MFGLVSGTGALIENLILADVTMSAVDYSGAPVGVQMPQVTINNCHVLDGQLTVESGYPTGGLVGLANGTVSNSSVKISVSLSNPTSSVGGLAGLMNPSVWKAGGSASYPKL